MNIMKKYLPWLCACVLCVALCSSLVHSHSLRKERDKLELHAMSIEHSHTKALAYLLENDEDGSLIDIDDRSVFILIELFILNAVEARNDPKWNLNEKTYKNMVELLKKEDLASQYCDFLIPAALKKQEVSAESNVKK